MFDENLTENETNSEQPRENSEAPKTEPETRESYYSEAYSAVRGSGTIPPEPEKKSRLGLVIALLLGIVLLVGSVGYAAGKLVTTVNGYKERIDSLEKQTTQAAEATPGETTPAVTTTEQPTTEQPASTTQQQSYEAQIPTGSVVEGIGGSLPDVSDIVENALPSVVSIEIRKMVTSSSFYGSYQYETSGAGSGIIIGDNGKELWVVTNYHVIEDAKSISVTFVDEKSYEAYLKGTSEENDIAVIGVKLDSLDSDTISRIRTITLGDSDSLKLGQGVIAIGNALGMGQSVTVGVVSALSRSVDFDNGVTMKLLQVSAAINPGNSGGALLNSKGELIGINNAKYSDTSVEGIGFAIPISSVREIMDDLSLIEAREPVSEEDYPYMGVTFKDLSSSYMTAYGIPKGAYVYVVGENTPAEKAGLLAYDIITAINGKKISSFDDLNQELKYIKGGTTVELTIQRLNRGRYAEETISMVLGYKKDYQ